MKGEKNYHESDYESMSTNVFCLEYSFCFSLF